MARTDRGSSGLSARPAVAPYQTESAVRAFVPARRAFFDEGLHAFKRDFVHHVARHDLTRRVVCSCDTKLGLSVEKFFSHCDGDAWFADNRGDEFFELGLEPFGFC